MTAVTLRTERGNIELTTGEMALYRALDRDRFRVWTRDELCTELGLRPRELDAAASRLRAAFQRVGLDMVANVWGVGFRLETAT